MHHETILAVHPGANPQERLVIAMRQFPSAIGQDESHLPTSHLKLHDDSQDEAAKPCCRQCAGSPERPIVMRQETFSNAVGWFTQSCIELTLDQWKMMRTTMVPADAAPSKRFASTSKRRAHAAVASSEWDAGDDELLVFPFSADQAVPA